MGCSTLEGIDDEDGGQFEDRGQHEDQYEDEYEDEPSESEEEETAALLVNSHKRDSADGDDLKDKGSCSNAFEQLSNVEENQLNENRQQRIVEKSWKASRANQELEWLPKKEEEEQISGGMLEANLLSRGASGLYCLLV